MPLSLEAFQERLRASGLVTDEAVRELFASLSADQRPEDGEHLARWLVRRQLLTAYQAQQIYLGKGATLVLGNYVLQEKLGQGGMGLVLKALHRRMHRTVALKVLSPDALKTPGLVERFHREVRAVAKLEHPHIVTAFDADEDRGVHFFVMQYVDGHDLSSVIKTNGPLPIEKAVEYTLQAAKGLEYAHRQGIIHRDIKPGNLLLANDGIVKILDMGLARIEDAPGDAPGGQADLTATGAVMGTVDYMSPEQALDTKHADARSDIYSLGCTLYFLLTGQPVFAETTMMKRLLAHREAPIPSVSAALNERSPGVATRGLLEHVDAVLQRMLAKRPEDRYQSMTEVVAALSALARGDLIGVGGGPGSRVVIGGSTVHTQHGGVTTAAMTLAGTSETIASGLAEQTLPTIVTTFAEPLAERHQHAKGPNPLVMFGVPAGVAVLLVVGLALGGFFGGKSNGKTTTTVTPSAVATAADNIEDAATETGPWAPGRIDNHWHGIVPQPATLDGVTRWQVETVAPRGRAVHLEWSPDGQRFVVYSEDERLRIYRWDGQAIVLDQIVPALDAGQSVRLKWSPDSRWIAWQGDATSELHTWDIVAGKYGPALRTGHRTGLAGWNADGTVLAAGSQDSAGAGVFFWEWPSGTLKHAARGFSQVPYLVEWSPDFQFVAADDGYDKVTIRRADGNPVATCPLPNGGGLFFLSWHPERPLLAIRHNTREPAAALVRLVNTETGETTTVIKLADSELGANHPPLWSHDGSMLVLPDPARNNITVAYDLEGRPGKSSPYSSDPHTAQRPHGNEWLITYSNGPSILWDFATDSKRLTLVPNGLVAGGWSPDGRWLAAISAHGELVVWDIERGVVAATQATGQSTLYDLVWDRASQRVSAAAVPTVHQPSPAAVMTWSAAGERLSRTEVGAFGVRSLQRWDHDRQFWALAQIASGYSVVPLDPHTGVKLPPLKSLVPSDRQLAVVQGSPVDDRVLVASNLGNQADLHILRLNNSTRVSIAVPEGSLVGNLAWAPDATRFASSTTAVDGGTPQVEIWEPSRPSRIATAPTGIGGKLAFSPDGKHLLITAGTMAWLVRSDTGAIVSEFPKGHGGAPSLAWSPDGRHAVVCTDRGTGGELEVVTTVPLVASESLALPRNLSTAWSPDGRLIAGSSQESLVRVWRNAQDEWRPVWTSVPLAGDGWATFSAGGKLLASSPEATRQLMAVVERVDGTVETVPWGRFVEQQTPLPPLEPVDHNR